jgi:hypothetical protein
LLSMMFCILCISVSGGQASAQAHPPYVMIDSGFPAMDLYGLHQDKWIDNDRFLFSGVQKPTADVNFIARAPGDLQIATFIWDIRTNKVEKYREYPLADFCVIGNRVFYKIKNREIPKKADAFSGVFGREKVIDLPEKYWVNQISCTYYTNEPEWSRRRAALHTATEWVYPLLAEHGWLESSAAPLGTAPHALGARTPVLVRKNGQERIELKAITPTPSIMSGGVGLNPGYRLSYLPFENRYLIWASVANLNNMPPAWYLKPSGEVERIVIPGGPWTSARYYAVKAGLFFVAFEGKRPPHEHAVGGGYLLRDGAVSKVVTGRMDSVAVSPDGCKVAFVYPAKGGQTEGYREWQVGKPGNTLRAVNLCAGGEK